MFPTVQALAKCHLLRESPSPALPFSWSYLMVIIASEPQVCVKVVIMLHLQSRPLESKEDKGSG